MGHLNMYPNGITHTNLGISVSNSLLILTRRSSVTSLISPKTLRTLSMESDSAEQEFVLVVVVVSVSTSMISSSKLDLLGMSLCTPKIHYLLVEPPTPPALINTQ